ncbi:MAG TPA: hypothetical protein VGO31_11055 [Microbacteriaceae bacterium]|nr:hypothetical protein [Microbacteriaceae bacterium]
MNDDQQLLIDTVASTFVTGSSWPIFDYVEGELDVHGIDAWTVLASLPTHAVSGYGAARWNRASAARPAPTDQIALTLLGLHHSTAPHLAAPMQDLYFGMLRFLSE